MSAALILVALALLVGPGGRAAEGREISVEPSPLYRLAQDVERGSPEHEFEFARIAVEEMIAEYASIASDARNERSPRRADRRYRWTQSVEGYVSQLRQALNKLENATPFAVIADERGDVRLKIGDQPLIITRPRLDRPDGLASRITERYCELAGCPSSIFEDSLDLPLPHGVWSFGEDDGPTLSTTIGLHCVFENVSDRTRKEIFCKRLGRELSMVLLALQRVQALGIPMHWERFQIARLVDGDEQTIIVNDRRDFFRLAVPILASSPGLQQEALDWLQSRLAGRRSQLTVMDADRFLRADLPSR